MKKIFIITFLILIPFLFSCKKREENRVSPVGSILQGQHELRRLNTKDIINSSLSGSFFLIAGGIQGESKTEVNIFFSWKDNEGDYIISKLPITKIRLHIDNSIKNPYIKFRWRTTCYDSNDVINIFKENIIYALICCNENDYPKNLNFNNF